MVKFTHKLCLGFLMIFVMGLPFVQVAFADEINQLVISSTYTSIYSGWDKYPGSGLDVDKNGNVYVAQTGSYGNYSVKLDNSLNLISETSTSYYGSYGITVLSTGHMVVVDSPQHGYNPPSGNHRIVKVDSNFTVLATFGSSAGSGNTYLYNPDRLASDRHDNVYVVDGTNNRLVKLNSELVYITEYQFDNISAVDVKDNYVYVASYNGDVLKKLDLDLNEAGIIGQIGSFGVHDIAVDSAGNIFAGTNSNITWLDSDFNIVAVFDDDSWFRNIMAIAIDQDNAIIVSNRYKGIAKFDNPFSDCKHATYSHKKRTLTVPFIEIPIIDFLTGQSNGKVELWTSSLRQVSGTTNRFGIIFKTLAPITDGSSTSCPATYAIETGTLSIPYVDIPTGIDIGNKKSETNVDVFKATMTWVPMGRSFVIQEIEQVE
ncbi:hypothetical protein [Candidatus Parabeggiatoa sp. HSG14]|uniref:hypothetical protein n=1 Tax=Candidatus Parabeggiatoa sp. HSG14 TaxID=3055593 RepID=UPI0025A75397|nr:hypothetical protein [Thiotrichales bacterium HSG14]